MPPSVDRAGPLALVVFLALAIGCSDETDPATQAADPLSPEANLTTEEAAIFDIQGRGHVSPKAGAKMATTGVVTAVAFNGFYLQHPDGDGDDATSDGIFVFTSSSPSVAAGQLVRVTGLVSEFVPGGSATGNLSTTQLSRVSAADPLLIEMLSTGNPLPSPAVIGRGGRVPPARHVISPLEIGSPIDLRDPAQAAQTPFNPEVDGIDFFESLEAMRARVQAPVAVSGTRTFNAVSSELFTLADGGRDAEPKRDRTDRGGIALGADPANRGDQQPERVQIQFDGTLYPGEVPAVAVGDRLGDVVGVVGYNFGNFEVNATETVPVFARGLAPETTFLTGGSRKLTVASYNALNLSAHSSDDAQRALLGAQIVQRLRSPDIIALQEIQDNNGEEGGAANLETDASQTLGALAAAVSAAGGPAYAFADVAPAPNSSGGVPGGNIRPSFLYRPDRVQLLRLQSVTPEVLAAIGSPEVSAFQNSRNPLAATFGFKGRIITVLSIISPRGRAPPRSSGPSTRSCRPRSRRARPRRARCTTTSPVSWGPTGRREWWWRAT